MHLAKSLSMVLFTLVALTVVHSTSCADEVIRAAEVERFAKLARVVAQQPITETPTKPMSDALDILLNASASICHASPAITSEQLMKRMDPFKKRLDPDKKATFESEPGWFDVVFARQGSRRAIAVTMGAVSRLKIVDEVNGDPIEVGKQMQWLYRYHQRPQFASNGTVVIISESVQDTGVRMGLRIDLLRQIGMAYRVQQTLKRLFVLDDAFPVELKGDRLTVRSVDSPKAILTSQADQHFGRIEEMAITSTGFRALSTRLLDPELRVIDSWLLAARQTKSPNAMQSLARRKITEGTLLSDCAIKSMGPDIVEATVEFDSAKIRFTLRKVDGAFRVFSLKALS